MLSKIASFEFRYQAKGALLPIVYLIFFLFAFGATTSDFVQIGASGSVHVNSPHAITMTTLILGVFGVFIPTAFLVSGILRDADYKTEEIFFSTSVRERDYLIGRFIGGFAATLIAFTSVPLAIWIGSFMPWLDPASLGPKGLLPYIQIFLIFSAPNLLVIGLFAFTVANFTRSTVLTYTALVGFIIFYIAGNAILSEPSYRHMVALLDPFGLNTYGEMVRYWTPFEMNAKVAPLEGVLLQNRLLWLGVSVGLFLLNLATFRFRKKASRRGRRKSSTGARPMVTDYQALSLPRAATVQNAGMARKQFFARVRLEIGGIVKNVAFWVLLVLGLANTVGALLTPGFFFGTPIYPVTGVMITAIGGSFSIIPLIIMVYYGAEIVWRERAHKVSDIIDATPAPNWAFVYAKLTGLILILIGLFGVSILTAITVQLSKGWTHLELSQYFVRACVEFIIPMSMIAVLSLFAQVITNNKWFGMMVMIAYIVSTMVMSRVGYEDLLYQFGGAPGMPYSDMNGYGHFLKINLWFDLYWGLFSIVLLVVTFLLWNRGAPSSLWHRVRHMGQNLSAGSASVLVACLIGFAATGSYIFYNTHVLNDFVTRQDTERLSANYEKTYKSYRDMAVPKITDVSIDVDIFPRERRYRARGTYTLVNKTEGPIDQLMIGYGSGTRVVSQTLEGGKPAKEDEDYLITFFAMDPPMAPGEARRFTFEVERDNPGFRNSGNVTTVNYNGTFFNNQESMPQIGYQSGAELSDPKARHRQDLPPVERAPKIDDEEQWYVNPLSPSADFVSFRSTVSTSADQIAIAPGYLQREWTEGDRRYFDYEMDSPIMNFYSWLSADYEVLNDQWNDVKLQVFYDEAHPYNVARMMKAMKDSLDYFTQAFSPYQHKQMRILEFPRYQSFAQSFPNTVPFSESIGFVADNTDPEDIDYVYYVTAHELAHQWWAHQVMGGNVQGATMLIETFSQYSALMVMEQEYGADHMRRFLKFELDRYLSGRGSEAIEELPIYLVENQQYIHYNKGSVVMYALKDYLGEDRLNRVLQQLIEEKAFRSDPYATTLDFLRLLRQEAGPEFETLIEDLFEKIVIFDLKVTDATARALDDGTYEVTLAIEAHKFEADGAGAQTEVPLDYMIDVGVFSKNLDKTFEGSAHVLFMKKERVSASEMTVTVIVDEEPKYAGIDPYNKLIDRNSDDNVQPVTLVKGS